MRNQYDNSNCLEMGDTAEKQFAEIAAKNGYQVLTATKEDNINSHIDFWITKNEKTISVDVKAAKRLSRQDSSPNYDYLWIELHSVRENNKGWLLDGHAHYIAFQQDGYFLCIKREKLIEIIKSSIIREYVSSPKDALYRIYRREGRHDKLTLIETKDILPESIIWTK